MIKKWILTGFVGFFALFAWAEITVTNLVVVQREGTKLVDISYNVSCDTTNEVWVTLSVSNGTESVDVSSVTGDVGGDVSTGTTKTMVWDMGSDWNGNVSTSMVLGLAVSEPSEDMVLIPGGTNSGTDPDYGNYSLIVDSFFMDKYEVTNDEMVRVMKLAYDQDKILAVGSSVRNALGDRRELFNLDAFYCRIIWNGFTFTIKPSKGSGYPCVGVTWYGAAAYCNYRSEIEGKIPCYDLSDWSCDFGANGYRLPTVTEWEYAARSGLSGKRFSWGDTITHDQANYRSFSSYSYDVSPTRGYHPDYADNEYPYMSPSGSFEPNDYGLYDMGGNVYEWCNTMVGSYRHLRGGCWGDSADYVRSGREHADSPSNGDGYYGFRVIVGVPVSEESSIAVSSIVLDSRDYLLSVSSDHGTSVPNIGTNAYAWYATVTCSVDSVVTSGLTNWTSAGWSGSGSVPSEGSTPNAGGVVLTGVTSSIAWVWNTNYWMDVSTLGSGSVDPDDGWRPAGSNVTVDATSSNGWLFMGWSGDASDDHMQESIIVPMVRPVSVTATFSDDADDDGLLNTHETALGTDPRKKDSDGDGSDDPDELIAGTSPTNSLSVLAVDLEFESFANELSFFGVSGRYYQIEYTDDLGGTWDSSGVVTPGSDAIISEYDFTAGPKRFYRVRVSDNFADL